MAAVLVGLTAALFLVREQAKMNVKQTVRPVTTQEDAANLKDLVTMQKTQADINERRQVELNKPWMGEVYHAVEPNAVGDLEHSAHYAGRDDGE